MNLKKWGFLFITTSLIGGLSILPTYIIVSMLGLEEGQVSMGEYSVWIFLFIMGVLFSLISQMGYFAYLSIHRFGLGIFRSHKLWNNVQIILILFTFFDLVYLRYIAFGETEEAWLGYVTLPAILLVVAVVVAYLKTRATQSFTFVPSLFFIFVVTTVEVVPVLTQDSLKWIILMVVPITLCNIWQLLILHRLTGTTQTKSA